MLTGQEDEQPRLISWIYSYQHFSPQGFGGKYAGQAVKNIHEGDLARDGVVDRLAIGNHDNNQPRIARDGNWRRERGKYKNEL